jgi:glycerol-3-phosphate dehydrogenase (NAD(P)+)
LQPLKSISIIGGGSWATALVKIFSENKITVYWYLRSQEQVKFLLKNQRNPTYLSFLELDMDYVHPINKLKEVVQSSDDILFAVPSAFLESTLVGLDEALFKGKRIYVSIKGLVTEDLLIPSVYLSQRFNADIKNITVMAGPCHAEEVAMDKKTFFTISGENSAIVKRVSSVIKSHYIHVICNHDPLGVEYSAILKNIIGIAGGIVKGLNYGDNFFAVVISNAMREVKAFLKAMDKVDRDLFDSAYFGDLLVTAYSEFSRNRSFGFMMGRGYSVPDVSSRMKMVAEGFYAVKGVYKIAKEIKLHMPVVFSVFRILYKHASPFAEFKLLEKQLL